MLHYILGGLLIFIAIIGFLDIKDLDIKDNDKIDPVDNLLIKEVLGNRKIFLTLISLLLIIYGLDLIFLR